jgi:hypothetical protein
VEHALKVPCHLFQACSSTFLTVATLRLGKMSKLSLQMPRASEQGSIVMLIRCTLEGSSLIGPPAVHKAPHLVSSTVPHIGKELLVVR